MSGNEASAIGSMRAINSGEATYASSCANGNYAVFLADLALAPPNSNAGFVSPDIDPVKVGLQPALAGGSDAVSKSGYTVELGPGATLLPITPKGNTCNLAGNDAIPTYFAASTPNTVGSTGQRSFGTDQRSTVYQDPTGAPFTLVVVTAATNPIQ
jgi:hypothetical protein